MKRIVNDIGTRVTRDVKLSKRVSKKDRKSDEKLRKKLNPKNMKNLDRDDVIFFESRKAWIKARKATDRVVAIQSSVSFLKYDANGKLCGLVFDEEN